MKLEITQVCGVGLSATGTITASESGNQTLYTISLILTILGTLIVLIPKIIELVKKIVKALKDKHIDEQEQKEIVESCEDIVHTISEAKDEMDKK